MAVQLQSGNAQASGPTPAVSAPHRDFVLLVCRILNVITAICLLLCAAAFAMAIVLRGDAPAKDVYFYSGQVVRCFGFAWSVMLVIVETEWRVALRLAPLLDIWLARATAYVFISALTFREAYPGAEVTDFQKSLQLYRGGASAALTACAGIYAVGGVLCFGAIRRARQQRQERFHEAESEFEELERRRRELQRLLGRGLAEP